MCHRRSRPGSGCWDRPKAAKNDGNDALSTAIAGLRHCGLRTVRSDDHTTVMRLLVGRYDDLVALRTQAACRLHAVISGARRRRCTPAIVR